MLRKSMRKQTKTKKPGPSKNPDDEVMSCLPNLNESRSFYNKEKHQLSGGNMSIILSQMRLAMVKHDWPTVQLLFLYFEKNKYLLYALEPALWRTALLIFLNSPMSNHSHFEEFLQQTGCIESRNNDTIIDATTTQCEDVFEKIITLKTHTVEL